MHGDYTCRKSQQLPSQRVRSSANSRPSTAASCGSIAGSRGRNSSSSMSQQQQAQQQSRDGAADEAVARAFSSYDDSATGMIPTQAVAGRWLLVACSTCLCVTFDSSSSIDTPFSPCGAHPWSHDPAACSSRSFALLVCAHCSSPSQTCWQIWACHWKVTLWHWHLHSWMSSEQGLSALANSCCGGRSDTDWRVCMPPPGEGRLSRSYKAI